MLTLSTPKSSEIAAESKVITFISAVNQTRMVDVPDRLQ